MAFAIKAEVVDRRARTFAFIARAAKAFYRQATDKIVGISDNAASFLSKCF